MKRSIIAIGGPHGSGKSSLARRLAEELKMNYVSAGIIFRDLAKKNNMSIEEFTHYVDRNPKIDQEIDNRTIKLADNDNTIVDAQLAAHFSPKDTLLRISITASPQIRWQRIAKRENISLDKAKSETLTREESERNRFLKLYNIDVEDQTKYDVIINSDRFDEDYTFYICLELLKFVLKK